MTGMRRVSVGAVSLFELLNLGSPDATEWMRDGLCAQTDPDAFFPERGRSTRPAKRVCQACPVREQCWDAAVAAGERHGVWGGRSERERRPLVHAHRAGADRRVA
jgi:WhiB family redox-sensing transcriptional regulator